MVDEKFVDGIGDVVINGMVVRIDLLGLDPSARDDDGKMRAVVRQRIVMPVDGFVQTVEKLKGTLPNLEKAGVIKRKSNGAAEVAEPQAAQPAATPAPAAAKPAAPAAAKPAASATPASRAPVATGRVNEPPKSTTRSDFASSLDRRRSDGT